MPATANNLLFLCMAFCTHPLKCVHLILILSLPLLSNAQQRVKDFKFYEEIIDNSISEENIAIANAFIEAELKHPLFKEDSTQVYFFKSRKMEVNYYFDLGKLGLIDAKNNLKWAMEKNNATMIMDCYNFIGLFNFMLGKWTESVDCYKKGLSYLSLAQPLPYATSTAFHLQNNLAEVYLKKGELDSAMRYCQQALNGAIAENNSRMQALSKYQIGDVYREKGENIEADSLLQSAITIAHKNGFLDVTLICLGNLGKSKSQTLTQRSKYFEQGFQLLKSDTSINPFYRKDFLKNALKFYEQTNNYAAQTSVLKQMAAIEEKKKFKELNFLIHQYDEMIRESNKRIALEKSNLQKSKEVQRLIIIIAIISILVLTAALIIVYLTIKRKNTILSIRSAISRDLHDDLGSSLSSLNIYSNLLANKKLLPESKQQDVVSKINTITNDLLNDLHDIIWSLDKNKMQTSLEDILKSYAMNILSSKGIEVDISIEAPVEKLLTSPKARKNIMLVLKEIMNNCSKYSKAKKFYLSIFLQKKEIVLLAKDDGVGFVTDQSHQGNGLRNIQKRIKELNGKATVHSMLENGTTIELRIPQKNIQMKEYFTKSVR